MDMNQHVNNVKYIGWVLEVPPQNSSWSLFSFYCCCRLGLPWYPPSWVQGNNCLALTNAECKINAWLFGLCMWEQSVPQSLSVAHELTSMTLEYRRECTPSDIVQSLSCPDSPLPVINSLQQSHDNGSALLGNGALDGSPGAVSCSSGALKSATLSPPTVTSVHYTHLLRMQSDGTEILRGRTSWRLKQRYNGACYWILSRVGFWLQARKTLQGLMHVCVCKFGTLFSVSDALSLSLSLLSTLTHHHPLNSLSGNGFKGGDGNWNNFCAWCFLST
jgi:hypothetical protein